MKYPSSTLGFFSQKKVQQTPAVRSVFHFLSVSVCQQCLAKKLNPFFTRFPLYGFVTISRRSHTHTYERNKPNFDWVRKLYPFTFALCTANQWREGWLARRRAGEIVLFDLLFHNTGGRQAGRAQNRLRLPWCNQVGKNGELGKWGLSHDFVAIVGKMRINCISCPIRNPYRSFFPWGDWFLFGSGYRQQLVSCWTAKHYQLLWYCKIRSLIHNFRYKLRLMKNYERFCFISFML